MSDKDRAALHEVLGVLRNPWGISEEKRKEARLRAADMLEFLAHERKRSAEREKPLVEALEEVREAHTHPITGRMGLGGKIANLALTNYKKESE